MITLALITIFSYMSIWFIVAQLLRRNDVADIAWGMGFVTLAWVLYLYSPSIQLSLVVLLVTIWGVRLSTHIYLRNRGKSEDFRYVTWRKQWGRWFVLRSYGQVFLLQGLLLTTIAAPLIALADSPGDSLGLIHLIGLGMWIFGFLFESIGDLQLSEFIQKRRKQSEILQSGLWKYTRHPNYFGEVVGWWGIWLLSYQADAFIPSVIGPLTITLLILKVSGIPLLERKYAANTAYQSYAKKTYKFFPWFPKG